MQIIHTVTHVLTSLVRGLLEPSVSMGWVFTELILLVLLYELWRHEPTVVLYVCVHTTWDMINGSYSLMMSSNYWQHSYDHYRTGRYNLWYNLCVHSRKDQHSSIEHVVQYDRNFTEECSVVNNGECFVHFHSQKIPTIIS